jgi:putative transposase
LAFGTSAKEVGGRPTQKRLIFAHGRRAIASFSWPETQPPEGGTPTCDGVPTLAGLLYAESSRVRSRFSCLKAVHQRMLFSRSKSRSTEDFIMPRDPGAMYRWRTWTPEQHAIVLSERFERSHPSHSPAHIESECTSYYMITAACFEHKSVIATSDSLTELLYDHCSSVFAWVVLPNHYHILVNEPRLKSLFGEIGQLHGRNSFQWNGEENRRGRQVWCKVAETVMKSEGHLYATINYILNNPVHHGYCQKWTDWPFSSVHEYLNEVGREVAMKRWQAYPLFEYGQKWDPPEL